MRDHIRVRVRVPVRLYRRSLLLLALLSWVLPTAPGLTRPATAPGLTRPATAPGLTRPATTAGGTLTVLEPGAPDLLDPLLSRTAAGLDATAPVFDALVRLDATGTFHSDLAARWRRSVDARTWTFTLDPHARWHDGEPVTAADVAFTVRLVRDARFGAASTLGFDHVISLTIGGASTVTMTLSAAYAPFLATVGVTPILPKHVLGALSPRRIRDYAPFNRHPIGSGPFTVADVTAGGRVIEEANPDYFGGAPHLDRLIFTPAPSRAAALAALRADPAATLLPPALELTPADVATLAGAAAAAGTTPLYSRGFAWTHLDLIEHGALADRLVRRALAEATPRGDIVAQVLAGHGHICDGDQAPGTPAYEPALHNIYRYNPRAARALLRRAGYVRLKNGLMGRGGVALTMTLWGDQSCPACAAALALIARGWRAAGVTTRLRLVPTTTLFGPRGPLYNPARFASPRYDAVFYTWVNGPDPDDSSYWTSTALVTPAHPLGGNFTGYRNPTLDALATRALVMPSGPGRYALYRQIQRILAADEPAIFLYWADAVSIVPRGLRGYSPTPYESAATWNAGQWQATSGS